MIVEPSIIKKKRIFSGLQPTGRIHIGNYIGAISVWREQQDIYENIFCIVDLHAMTIPEAIDPKTFQEKIRGVAAMYLACGIDPEKSAIFVQSHISEHAELSWILNCITPMGWLNRMTQFKSKSDKLDTVGTGLFDYPVLQAADILLYDTNYVPVGEDQKQHIELTQEISRRFNHLFGKTFVVPNVMIRKEGARIMALDNPEIKMSKSETSKYHAIYLTDDDKTIRKVIMSSVTDSGIEINFERLSPGLENLLTIYKTLSGITQEQARKEFEGKGYGVLKKATAEIVITEITKIRNKYFDYIESPQKIDAVLEAGADSIRGIAQDVLYRAYKAIGMR